MDGFYSSGRSHNPRNLKLRGLNTSNSISQIDSALIKYLYSGSPGGGDVNTSPVTSKYQYSGGVSMGSRSGSPLSSLDNIERSQVFGSPMKVEEDVLVMDGILVGSVPGGRRSCSDSGGSGSSSGKSTYKKEICRSWEDSSHCRFGSKCQFAHGKEELRPGRFLNKNKPEVNMEKAISSIIESLSLSSGSKSRPAKQAMVSPAVTPEKAAAVERSATNTIIITRNWSPYDDGIEIGMLDASADHKPPSREVFDAMMDTILHGSSTKKRLPVFVEICPE